MALLNGLAKVTILCKLGNGQAVSNTFHIVKESLGSPPDIGTLSALSTDLGTWFGVTYEALLLPADTLQSITVYQVSDPTAISPTEEAVNAIVHAGTNGGGTRTVPASTCPLLSLHTIVASKRARGHMFLPPGISGADLTSGNAYLTSSAWWTLLQALRSKFAAGCTLTPTWTGTELPNWSICIYSKVAAIAGDPSITVCTTATTSAQVHWLRSRERGSS